MILGIIIVLAGIPLTTLTIKNQTILKSRASGSEEPRNIQITNISDKSFTITYQTDSPTTGSISYGNSKKLGESELEDTDKEKGSFSPKKIHSISTKALMPSTKYYLTIISGSNTFLDKGAPLEIITGPDIASLSAKQIVIKGKIALPNGNAPLETLVYLSTDNSQLLSSTVDKDGKFGFSLKDLRTNNLSSHFNADENTILKITAIGDSLKSTALVSLSQAGSIPTITLSNDYDFTQKTSPIATKSAESLGFPSIAPSGKTSKLEITNLKENQSLTDPKPKFEGTSLPNEKVEIIIHSDEQITASITSDNNGNWTYALPSNLSPGNHTITIKTRDSSGILTTIMRSFTVFAAEPQKSGSATPSATPIQMPSPTSFPTIAIETQAPISTLTPFPTIVPMKSKDSLPPTGSAPIPLIIGGITAMTAGLALFLFSHKISL